MNKDLELLEKNMIAAYREIVELKNKLAEQENTMETTADAMCLKMIDWLELAELSQNTGLVKNIAEYLELQKIIEIRIPNNKYNEELCEIVSTAKDIKKPHNYITEILKKGYWRDNRILRKAKVIVINNA